MKNKYFAGDRSFLGQKISKSNKSRPIEPRGVSSERVSLTRTVRTQLLQWENSALKKLSENLLLACSLTFLMKPKNQIFIVIRIAVVKKTICGRFGSC